jgi:hypothetical protein
MSRLEERMVEKGFTYYAMNQFLGRHPRGGFTQTKNQLTGKNTMNKETYDKVLEILDLKPEEVPFTAVQLKLNQCE